jgi:septal ring factor EnvC (AmiA/AmiB activator)
MSEEWCAHGLSLNCKDCRIEQLEAYNAEHQSVCQLQEQHIERLEAKKTVEKLGDRIQKRDNEIASLKRKIVKLEALIRRFSF